MLHWLTLEILKPFWMTLKTWTHNATLVDKDNTTPKFMEQSVSKTQHGPHSGPFQLFPSPKLFSKPFDLFSLFSKLSSNGDFFEASGCWFTSPDPREWSFFWSQQVGILCWSDRCRAGVPHLGSSKCCCQCKENIATCWVCFVQDFIGQWPNLAWKVPCSIQNGWSSIKNCSFDFLGGKFFPKSYYPSFFDSESDCPGGSFFQMSYHYYLLILNPFFGSLWLPWQKMHHTAWGLVQTFVSETLPIWNASLKKSQGGVLSFLILWSKLKLKWAQWYPNTLKQIYMLLWIPWSKWPIAQL